MGVVNRDNALYMATVVDNSGLKKGVNEAERIIDGLSDHAEKAGIAIGSMFAVKGFQDFITHIVRIRGEIQMLESSFDVLLGGKGVENFMSQLKQFAVDSPLSLSGVSNAAQTLLGFNIEAEKVIPTIKQIGDISMGNEDRFKSLTLAFAQMSSTGKLMGQDLLQMINAGFNPLSVISEKTGKSIGELKKEMESGAISSETVAEAFRSATAEGGKFYGMTQKQAEGIKGLQAQLEGGLQDVFNEIGKSQEDIIVGGYKIATTLVENYEKIGDVLKILVSSYGVYKAALISTVAIQKSVAIAGNVKAWLQLAASIRTAKDAQIAFSLATKANPIGLALATITAVAGGVYLYTKRLNEATESEKAFANIKKNTDAEYDKSEAKIKSLVKVIESEYSGNKNRISALNELKSIIPGYNGMLDEEGRLIRHNKETIDEYLVSLRKQIELKGKEAELDRLYELRAEKEAEKKAKTKEYDSVRNNLLTKINPLGIFTSNQAEKLQTKWINEELNGINEAIKEVTDSYIEQKFEAKKTTDETGKGFVNISDEVDNTKTKISDLKQSIADLRSGKTQVEVGVSLSDEIDKKVKELSDAEKTLHILTGVDKITETKAFKDAEKSNQEQIKLQERINEEMRKLVEKNISDRIALMDEGTQKEVARIRDRYSNTIAEIQRQETEWRKNQGGNLTAEQEVIIKETKHIAASTAVKEEEEVNKQLLEKYQDYADQRLAVEEKFNKDIADLQTQRAIAEEQGNSEMVENLDRALAKATKEKGKALIGFDFNVFKESPEYVRAFEDLKNTSTGTLNYLAEQLEAYKIKASESLDPTELQAYTAALQAIIDELTERNPFGALTDAQNRLTASSKKLAGAKKKLKAAEDSGDTEKVTEAQKELNEAMDEYSKTSNDVQKAQKKVIDTVDQLYDAISGVGDALGGTAGEILNFIADIGRFVSVTAEGMTTTAKGASTAVQMIEKASAILFIIQMALQLINKLQSFIKDSHQQYLDYSKEIAQINALRDAVTDYEIAVTKARQAQESWFAEDRLRDLKNEWELNSKYLDAYNKKVDEQQAKYENEKGGGWLTNTVKWLGDAYSDTLGKVYDMTVGKVSETLMGDIGKTIANIGEGASFGLGTQAAMEKYNKDTVKAIDNLRIETKAKKKGFLGTGIGGQSQKTMDLREWARENGFGQLFDENNIIDTKVAEAILKANEEGTIKLVGETEKTLETLVEYQKLYEEYKEQLQEYVSSLYSPLVDNLVDAIWDWFDSTKDVLDSFKEYAGDTFREIASDMVRNLANKHIFADYDKEILDLYDKYFASDMTEADTEQLYKDIADATEKLDKRIEEKLPILQDSLVGLDKSLQNIGINIQDDSEIKENTLKGAYAKASQESIDLLAGQTGAVRVILEEIARSMKESGDTAQLEQFKAFNDNLASIREMAVAGWNNVAAILEVSRRVEDVAVEIRVLNDRIADSNDAIQISTKSAASSLEVMENRGVKMLGLGLGL